VSVAERPEAVEKKSAGEDASGILAKCSSVDQAIIENGAVRPRSTTGRTGLVGAMTSFGSGRKSGEKSIHARVEGIKTGSLSSGDGDEGKKFSLSREEQGRKKNWEYTKQDVDPNDTVWGTPRGQKSDPWGHDDRFDKDYDFYGKQAQRGEGTFRPRNRSSNSGNWRDRKGGEGKEQKGTTNTVEPNLALLTPPPLPEEENWD
jgi:hypothetical protein